MVGRERAISRGKRGAVLVRQLLGVEPDAQAVMRRRLEHPLDLFRREGDRLAKSVDAGREPLLRGGRDQLVDDLADIMGAAVRWSAGSACSASKVGTIRTASPSPSSLAIFSRRSSLFGSSP